MHIIGHPSGLPVDVFKPGGDVTNTGALRTTSKAEVIYDSDVVAAGAQIQTGILDLRGFSSLRLVLINSDGASARVLQIEEYLEDGTTKYMGPIQISPGAINSTRVTGMTAVASADNVLGMPPAFARFTVPAAGTSNGRLTIVAR